MSSNKTGMTEPRTPKRNKKKLAGTMIYMLATGVAGGTVLVAGAKALGDRIEKRQVRRYKRIEDEREAQKEEVRRIMMNDPQETYEEE